MKKQVKTTATKTVEGRKETGKHEVFGNLMGEFVNGKVKIDAFVESVKDSFKRVFSEVIDLSKPLTKAEAEQVFGSYTQNALVVTVFTACSTSTASEMSIAIKYLKRAGNSRFSTEDYEKIESFYDLFYRLQKAWNERVLENKAFLENIASKVVSMPTNGKKSEKTRPDGVFAEANTSF